MAAGWTDEQTEKFKRAWARLAGEDLARSLGVAVKNILAADVDEPVQRVEVEKALAAWERNECPKCSAPLPCKYHP